MWAKEDVDWTSLNPLQRCKHNYSSLSLSPSQAAQLESLLRTREREVARLEAAVESAATQAGELQAQVG